MKNRYFESVDDFTDVKLKGLFHDRVSQGQDPDAVLKDLSWWSRDNARTPMQWHGGEGAGFTSGVPWFGLNPNYIDINVALQSEDPHSVLAYYKYIISLRRSVNALSVGSYEPLRPDDWTVWAVKRSYGDEHIVIVFNFSARVESIELPNELTGNPEFLLGNYGDVASLEEKLILQPWETRIYRI
jgi:glycosidase